MATTIEGVTLVDQGGSLGTAVTIANGADVAEGQVGDVAWVSGNGTIISILKAIAGGGPASTVNQGDAGVESWPVVEDNSAAILTAVGSINTKLTNPLPVSASSLPLPTGAATAARQDTGNTSLAAIKLDTDNLDVALSTRLKPADTLAKVTTVDTITNPVAVTAASLPLPTGASTAALQTTGNTSLGSIKTNTDPLVASGGGGYVRQDSTATIAKESGGNLATVAVPVYVKGGTELVQAPTVTQASDNGTPITTAATTDVVSAPSAGNHLEIHRLHITNFSATPVLCQWKEASGTLKYPSYLPQYGIMSIKLDGSWHLTSATKLQLVTSAAGSIYWHVDSRTVAD